MGGRWISKSLQNNKPEHCPHQCRCCTNLSVHLQLRFPITHEQVPKIQQLPTQWRWGHSTFFWSRTMASDLEVLILIPAALHSAANHPSAYWKSVFDDANRTLPSAKSGDRILKSSKPYTICLLAAPRNSIHKNYEQN